MTMKMIRQIFKLEDRLRQLPKDEGGSVLLLTGMMAFMACIMSLFAMDTSQAIYKRIVAQNAADGAAETGALWQARGLNMLQSLNNAHYIFNAAIYVAEWNALAACPQAAFSALQDYVECPCSCPLSFCSCCPNSIHKTSGLCSTCNSAGTLNDKQHSVAQAILTWQGFIVSVIPVLGYVYASDVAQASGADELNVVRGQMPGMTALGPIPPTLPYAPYATTIYPIFPPTQFLNNKKVDGNHWPWKWDQWPQPETAWKTEAWVAWEIGKRACQLDIWQTGRWLGQFHDHDSSSDWGWDDQYYHGVPGNMVWIAGKTNQTELAGLGFLRWMNGGNPASQVTYSFMNQQNVAMYTGSSLTSTEMTIPAVVAVASSQAEGSKVEVVAKDTKGNGFSDFITQLEIWDMPPVDSAPKLTTVTIPGTALPASYLDIFH